MIASKLALFLRSRTDVVRLAAALSFTMAAVSPAALSAPLPQTPAVFARYTPGGPGGWDYLSYDADGRRLFVSRGDRVVVLDADHGSMLGEIAGTAGVHGIALVPSIGKGFTSNGKSNTVTVFDLKTLGIRQQIAIGGNKPDAIIYDAASGHVLTFNGGSNNVTVIDAASEVVVATIALSSNPEFAATDGKGHVYVNLEDQGALAAIDTLHNTVVASWPLPNCEEPSGLAFDPVNQLSFSTCQNRKMVVFDVRRGKAVTALPIGMGPDAAAFDPLHQRVYASNGDGTLSVYHVDAPRKFSSVATVVTQKSARTMALDVTGQRVFLPAAEFGPTPAPTTETPKPRPPMTPGSFSILVVR